MYRAVQETASGFHQGGRSSLDALSQDNYAFCGMYRAKRCVGCHCLKKLDKLDKMDNGFNGFSFLS
jgi:hypothetical protein